MECDFAPYNWEQNTAENGAVPIHYEDSYAFGYDVLVAQKICETYGWQLEILKFNWDALVPAVVSGTVDCAIAGQSVTDDRLSYVDFTQPYYRASIVAVTREGSDYADAQTLSDLTGASCSSQENTVWYDECLQQITDAKIKEATEDVKEMFDGLDKEEYDIVVTDEPTALAACAEYPGLKILDFSGTDDDFMDNVPYEEWAEYVTGILQEYGITDGLVLDLGCGTGSMTELLAEKGYDMIGVDLSADMLEIAMYKRSRTGLDSLYLQQDMREFELYGTVRAIVCVCDSINYLESEEDLLEVFRLANNYLDPGGIFVFDLNTPYKYREILGDSVIAENRDECSFIWENTFYEEDGVNEYDLTIFCREEGGLYRKYEETHFQKAFDRKM